MQTKVIDQGKMVKLKPSGLARKAGGSSPQESTGDMDWNEYLCRTTCTEEDVRSLMAVTNCPLCRYPKDHPKNHHLPKRPLREV